MTAAAIILCAGKGSRMNDDSQNKVCFECAGTPVIRRIIDNMRKGGVSRFVVVVGHQAATVMDTLDGVDGVVYAYQKEQKGTGHAALIGMKALKTVGYDGPVIVSMGDKIVASNVVEDLLSNISDSNSSKKVIWGVQPAASNPGGGRVVVDKDGTPYGVVEMADAAYMSLAGKPQDEWETALHNIGLNEKKAAKVLKLASQIEPKGTKSLAGKDFTAAEILSTPYANNALYCFDLAAAMEAIGTLGSDNAQGEVYLTDTLEIFAKKDQAKLYVVENPDDLLTFSTKPELRKMGYKFLRKASDFLKDLDQDKTLDEIYEADIEDARTRIRALLSAFIAKYGDRNVIISRSPGRVNLMGRHIDHRGGGVNVLAVNRDTIFVVSPREDDIVNISNVDPQYSDASFSISETLALGPHNYWLDYLEAEPVIQALKESKGHWSNYVKSAVLRLQLESSTMPLCGMDMMATGNIPAAAGLSSSSSIVVAVGEAVKSLNCLNLTRQRFIDLCGEGEWFVGSRGGAADHAAMICGAPGRITHLDFKPFRVGESVPFPKECAVVVVDSTEVAKKSEGSKDKFNAKVASYEFALMMLNKYFPTEDLKEFRDLAEIRPFSKVYKMLKTLPEAATRDEIRAKLSHQKDKVEHIFSSHADPGLYDIRGVALFGIAECCRSKKCMDFLKKGDFVEFGKMMKISHDGDRLCEKNYGDKALEVLASKDEDIANIPGDYGCSTPKIDALCDMLNAMDGVLGSSISGAGLGGCVLVLAEKEKAGAIVDELGNRFYAPQNRMNGAMTFVPSEGARVVY